MKERGGMLPAKRQVYPWYVAVLLAVPVPCGACPSASPAATLAVEPLRGLADKPFTVRIAGVPAGAQVRVQAAFTDDEYRTWTAYADYVADDAGTVDTFTAPAVQGTYRGIQPGGLSCSMLPVAQDELPRYLESMREQPGRMTPAFGKSDSAAVTITAQVAGITYALPHAQSGTPVAELCRQLGVSEARSYLWKKKYRKLRFTEIREFRQLREENTRLRRLVAELTPDKHIFGVVVRKL